MVSRSITVLRWYRQQKDVGSLLFRDAISAERKVSIHDVVNANAGITRPDKWSNTLALLRLVRKRQAIIDYLLYQLVQSPQHKVNARRLLSAYFGRPL